MKEYDLIVIGGGPAGYNSAEYASRKGLKVLLVEKDRLGGTCLNVGCIPTKTLLFASKQYHSALEIGEEYGVSVKEVIIDQSKVVDKKNQVAETLVNGVRAGLRRHRVDVVSGVASIAKGGKSVKVSTGEEEFLAKDLIIATGASPVMPPIKGAKEGFENGSVLTSNEILDLREIPENLVVIGGGVIGFEMAAYYQEVGSHVTVIEMMDSVLGANDKEICALLQKEMEKKGVSFCLSSAVKEIGDGKVYYTQNGEDKEVACDKVLMCVGRRPNPNIEGLEACGVQVEKGAIKTDDHMRTTAANIYAIGDVNGKAMLAHVGYREGEVAVNDIVGIPDSMSYDAISGVVYTHPEAAFVGMSEEDLKANGIDYEVKKVSVNMSGRHIAENGMSNGICKLMISKKQGIILGAAVMSSYASEFIYALALMIQNKLPVESLKRTVFPHPTVCEVIREALLA